MSFDSSAGASKVPMRRRVDVVVTIVLLVLFVPFAVVGVIAGAFLVLASDSCGPDVVCNDSTLSLGVLISICSPVLLFVITGIVAIMRMYRRRRAFWVPLVGAGITVVLWVGGAAITAVSVPH